MPLAPEQVAHFCAHGYLAVPRFFTPREVERVLART